jgi:hypothetical protein
MEKIMALKDVLSLIDDKLADVFHTRAYDPAKDREKLVKRLEATKAKFLQTEPARGRKDFSVQNNTVAYSPTLPSGDPITLGDKPAPYYIPSERFTDVVDGLIAATKAGELDKALEGKGEAKVTKPARTPRKKTEGGSTGRGWTEERRAKFAATVAARNAAK